MLSHDTHDSFSRFTTSIYKLFLYVKSKIAQKCHECLQNVKVIKTIVYFKPKRVLI